MLIVDYSLVGVLSVWLDIVADNHYLISFLVHIPKSLKGGGYLHEFLLGLSYKCPLPIVRSLVGAVGYGLGI